MSNPLQCMSQFNVISKFSTLQNLTESFSFLYINIQYIHTYTYMYVYIHTVHITYICIYIGMLCICPHMIIAYAAISVMKEGGRGREKERGREFG